MKGGKLYDFAEVDKFISRTDIRMEELKTQRNKIYNQIRRCKDPTAKEDLIDRRDFLTSEISALREKITLQNALSRTDRGLRKVLNRKRHLSVNGTSPKELRSKKNIMKGGKYYER